jgi:hypothetical protein
MTFTEIKDRANALPDDRTPQQKIADSQREPTRLKGPGPLESYLHLKEQQKEDRRLLKMSRDERSIQIAKDILEREPETPAAPHTKQAKVLKIIEAIVSDPTRQRADYDLARLVYESFGPGMDHEAAGELFKELVAREETHLTAKRQLVVEKQSALIAELQALDTRFLEVSEQPPHNAQHYGILANGFNSGFGYDNGFALSNADRAEVLAAAGDEAKESAVVAKYAEKIAAYIQAAESEAS